MTKSDLRTGMVVENENGFYGVVLRDTATVDGIKWIGSKRGATYESWEELSDYSEQLTSTTNTKIAKVYQTSNFSQYLSKKVMNDENIIWDRDDAKIQCAACGFIGEEREFFNSSVHKKFKICPKCGSVRFVCDDNRR